MARKTLIVALALMAGWGAVVGMAHAADPAPPSVGAATTTPGGKVVLVRQGRYKELNAAFKAINEELKKDAPDKAVLATNASKMKALAEDLAGWFPKGSGPEAGVPTRAKAEIWTDAEGFAAAASGLQAQTVRLEQVAMAGDLDAVKAEAKATGAACAACHGKFRGPEPH